MPTRNEFKLFKKVLELSEAKDWNNAKKEWEQIKITQADDKENYGKCTCEKYPIKEKIQLFNSKNRNEKKQVDREMLIYQIISIAKQNLSDLRKIERRIKNAIR